jgi:hypothetical protein
VDPITVIVTAVALGVSTGLKDTTAKAITDAYTSLKTLLTQRRVDITPVEKIPASAAKQDSLREDLQQLEGTPDAVDQQLLDAAQQVITAVKTDQPAAGAAIGIDLDEFHAASLRVSGVTAAGTGVRGTKWTIDGDAVFDNIHAGQTPTSSPDSQSPPNPGSGGGGPS